MRWVGTQKSSQMWTVSDDRSLCSFHLYFDAMSISTLFRLSLFLWNHLHICRISRSDFWKIHCSSSLIYDIRWMLLSDIISPKPLLLKCPLPLMIPGSCRNANARHLNNWSMYVVVRFRKQTSCLQVASSEGVILHSWNQLEQQTFASSNSAAFVEKPPAGPSATCDPQSEPATFFHGRHAPPFFSSC